MKKIENVFVEFYKKYIELEKILLPMSFSEKTNFIECLKDNKIKEFYKRNKDLFYNYGINI